MSTVEAPTARRAGASKLLGWLPPGRASRQLLAIFFIDSVGTGLFLAGSALFFTRAVGLTSAQVGVGLSLSAVAGFLCSVPLGRLADRIGSRRTIVVLYLWRGLGFLAYVFVDNLAGFLVVACFLGASEWAVGPLVQALVGSAEEGNSRVRTMAAMNAMRNIGFMLGALLATLAIATGTATAYRALVYVNAWSFFIAALLLRWISVGTASARQATTRRVRVRDVRYLTLAASNGVLFLHTALLSVGLPLWIATRTEAPAAVVGVVVALNTVIAITLGVRLSRGGDGLEAGAARHHWAGWTLAACCALVALSGELGSVGATVVLLAATAALTLGELWQSMGGWGVSHALAPEDQRNTYLTIYYLGEPLASMAGPALLTIAVISTGGAGWLALAVLFAVTGLTVRRVATRHPQHRNRSPRTVKGASMRELMLIGVGRMGRPYVTAARRLGLRVRAVEAASRVDAVADAVDDVHPCRGELDEQWAEAAAAAVVAGRPDGVVAFSEPHVMAAALVQDRLGLPGPSLHAAALSRNKALQRATFAAHGVGQPDFIVTDDLQATAGWAAPRLPVVVKPLSSAGSAGVELVADLQAFHDVAARRAGERPLLVETAIGGPEFSWEALVQDGEVWFSNITAKETTGPPHFVELVHRTGVELPPAEAEQVERFAAAVLTGLGMVTGLVHMEFRLTNAGPTLMEVAVRTPGDFLMEVLGLTYGVDWFELVVRAALRMPLPDPPAGPTRYAASYLPTATPGIVTEIRGLDEVRRHRCVVEAELRVAEGQTIAPLRSSAQRVGHVLIAADGRDELESALAYVRATLDVRTHDERVELVA